MNFYPFPIIIKEIPTFHSYDSNETIMFLIDHWFDSECINGVNIAVCHPVLRIPYTYDDVEIANQKWTEVQWDWKRIIRRLQQPEDIDANEYVAERCP